MFSDALGFSNKQWALVTFLLPSGRQMRTWIVSHHLSRAIVLERQNPWLFQLQLQLKLYCVPINVELKQLIYFYILLFCHVMFILTNAMFTFPP